MSVGSRRVGWSAWVVVAVLVVSGCTGGGSAPSGAGSSPAVATPSLSGPVLSAPSLSTPVLPTPASAPTPARWIEFAYEAPDPVCVPVSELPLPGADEYDYRTDPSLIESYNIRVGCVYDLDGIVDGDHVRVYVRASLYPHRDEAIMLGAFPDLPVDSEDLNDWAVAVLNSRAVDPWTEGCPLDPACGEGEDTGVEAWWSEMNGMVGNLEFDSRIHYIAESPPDDALITNLEIFRAFVLAELERRPHTSE